MLSMAIKLTTAYWKIQALTKKVRVIQGGQSASKTYSILITLLQKAMTEGCKITIVTATYPQLRDGVISDMKSIMSMAGIDFDACFSHTTKNLNLYGSQIQFRNLDNLDYHKSKGARRDYLYINEANRVNYLSVEQMITRTIKGTYIDFNPDREFWVHEHILKGGRDDVDFIILTYQDNECISEGERKEIEMRRSNANWWRVYGEGQLGVYSDRQIYQYEFIDEIPFDAKRIPSGMDFGLSPDPTTLVDLYIKDNWLIADEVFTENNLMQEKINGAERMSIVDKMQEVNFPKGHIVFADSSSRVSIQSLRNHGYQVYGVEKLAGSVIEGIKIVKSYDLKITKRSRNLKQGIESWFFKIDDNGKIIPEPDGHEPDQLAAIRYVMMKFKRKPQFIV